MWNDAAARLFGYSEAEMLGQSYLPIVPARFRPAHEQGMRGDAPRLVDATTAGLRRWSGVKANGEEFLFDMSIRHWDVRKGTCVAASIVPVSTDGAAAARIPVVSAANYDTTVAEAIPQLVWVTNAPGRVEYCNRRWYEYFGLGEADLAFVAQREILHPEQRADWIDRWVHALASASPF